MGALKKKITSIFFAEAEKGEDINERKHKRKRKKIVYD